tara:strand:+ start:1114 stop:1539 length:426 start_codon:yes stop_codon:yes gene_type:complete
MIRVKYNSQTTKVEGYFPSNINYVNNVIDKELKTIDNFPYIEVSQEEHQEALGKKMCILNGVLTEYIKASQDELEEAKSSRRASRKQYLVGTDYYLLQEIDEPNTYPPEVKAKRILARKERREIKEATTLEQVQSYNEIFE